MALPKIEQYRIDLLFSKYCVNRIPSYAKDQRDMNYKVNGNKVLLIESKSYNDDPTKWTHKPVAQFEYNETTRTWSLYGYDKNPKRIQCSIGNLEKLIQEVNKDITGIFWR